MKEMVGGCCVCSDERGWPDNPLVYCDGNGCTVAVHQACYGIVTVPTGPWYCRKCESPETKGKVRCELCPSKSGALKRTDTGGWAHVVCALYIPEVRFGNVTSMEPIVLRLIPPERYNKTCYICHDMGKSHRATVGACMQCNKSGCRQALHVTCAQSLGLLCEEAGNYLDNVKYCGYCLHHYSKLKKGGNVKTIPPYKPVSHDSHSSDSSCEKEGEASPMASGSGTPTHPAKSKGPGRKSSHTSTVVSGKSTPSASKTPTHTPQHMDKKKPSPSRRGSSAGDSGGPGSKSNTPAPSPQHTIEHTQGQNTKASGSTTPGGNKVVPPAASPSSVKPQEPVGVISSVASAVAAAASAITVVPTSAPPTMSVVQIPMPKPAPYQESVIINTDAVETKQTKKRKAINAANSSNAPVDYAPTPPPTGVQLDANSQNASTMWDTGHSTDIQMEGLEKIIKKAKTDSVEGIAMSPHFSSVNPAPPPPPPPPAHSPAPQRSPRHLAPSMPGPSGLQVSNIRSPSQPQITASDMPGPSHIFHQPQKQLAMESSIPGHSQHGVPGRSTWGGLNVSYEMQDPSKPGGSGVAGSSKDVGVGGGPPMPPTTIRNKKRAAMATAVSSMPNPPPPSAIQTSTSQSLANVRRQPQPTQPPIYQETIKDSPPSSPSSDRPLKSKMEPKMNASCTAPHMLGNELNPDSGAAARLQEQLSAELAAHAAGSVGADPLILPPLINKAAPSTSGTSGRSSTGAQSLDQLLERQWEQGSQFLMEQAQHFDTMNMMYWTIRRLLDVIDEKDRMYEECLEANYNLTLANYHKDTINEECLEANFNLTLANYRKDTIIASLLSCLHQLRTENVRLEEHVGNLLQRRDHLLAVNARLAIPLTAVTAPPEPPRCPRENIPQQVRAPQAPVRNETVTSERSHQLVMREAQQKPS